MGHVSAIIGLILIPLGWAGLRNYLADTRTERLAYLAATLGYIGSALSISYYGAEVYGLRAIGARAVADGDASLTKIGEDFRMDAIAVTVFVLGLALIAAAAILAAVAIWRSGTMARWSGIPLATAMVLYLPHFSVPARRAHRLGCAGDRRRVVDHGRTLAGRSTLRRTAGRVGPHDHDATRQVTRRARSST